jgi:hypothetical protein
MYDVINTIHTCGRGHTFRAQEAPDWHESGIPYCPVCQGVEHARFFERVEKYGIDHALLRVDPAVSQLALYRASREKGLDVVYYKGNVWPVHGQGDAIVFKNVSLYRGYVPFLCRLFVGEEMQELGMSVRSPRDFARVVENRPFDDWCGGAGFGTFETSSGRGWVYKTLHGCRLFFIPNRFSWPLGDIYCLGLDDSVEFRRLLVETFGVPYRDNLPKIREIVWVQRPCVSDGRSSVPDNRLFWRVAYE